MVDETYVEFVEDINQITSVSLTKYYNNIIILRGISKFLPPRDYGLAMQSVATKICSRK